MVIPKYRFQASKKSFRNARIQLIPFEKTYTNRWIVVHCYNFKTKHMKIFTSLSLSFLLFSLNLFAQNEVFLTFTHKLGSDLFAFNQSTQNNLGHDYTITRIDYYVSNITVIHDGGTETSVEDLHLLVRASDDLVGVFSLGNLNVTNVEGITFSIGVDPSLNNADPNLQTEESPLYFQFPSMHWGWSSGYRFVALEGYAGANLTTLYQFHGLWNQNYFEQTVAINAQADADNNVYIHLDADYIEAVRGVNLISGPIHHGTNQDDLKVLMNFRDHVFSAGTGELLSLESESADMNFSVFPNPTSELVHIHLNNSDLLPSASIQLEVHDYLGRIIVSTKIVDHQTSIDVSALPIGVYLFKLSSGNDVYKTHKIVKH